MSIPTPSSRPPLATEASNPVASDTARARPTLKTLLFKLLPWLITIAALYFAFRGIDVGLLWAHVHELEWWWIAPAVSLTALSYLLRSRRWQRLFPEHTLSFPNAVRVLFLGFFMNNILPARAGEFVRAHMGAKLTGQKRTLVLATVASERLVDGLTISFMFALFALGLGDANLSHNMSLVAWLFLAVGIVVLGVLGIRGRLIALAQRLHDRVASPRSAYALDRLGLFLHGLSPLCSPRKVPRIAAWSLIIWSVELVVYFCVARALGAELTWAQCVLFLVAVNFSSLIPAAPGGIGVIEAVASAVLVSIGVPREQALCMAICQHLIQYLVVGLPGAVILFNWKKTVDQVRAEAEADESPPDTSHLTREVRKEPTEARKVGTVGHQEQESIPL